MSGPPAAGAGSTCAASRHSREGSRATERDVGGRNWRGLNPWTRPGPPAAAPRRRSRRALTAGAGRARGARSRSSPETGSTNADVAARRPAGEPEGLVLAADHQAAGRGRLGRAWEAPPRAGLAVVGAARGPPVDPARWSWLPLLAGLARRRRADPGLRRARRAQVAQRRARARTRPRATARSRASGARSAASSPRPSRRGRRARGGRRRVRPQRRPGPRRAARADRHVPAARRRRDPRPRHRPARVPARARRPLPALGGRRRRPAGRAASAPPTGRPA